jgi:homoserine O-acetyltransferase
MNRIATLAVALGIASILAVPVLARAQDRKEEKKSTRTYPAPSEGDHVLREFRFASGETLAELKLHYRTLGTPQRDDKGVVRNAVLILHGTTGQGGNFLRPEFAGELFGKGQPLDATRYFLILPDGIGHGKSSKPSDGLRAKFPRYGYHDMIEAQYRLVREGLKVDHLRLVMGTSMGGMHTWLWGQKHTDFVDALMPLASLPTEIAGRNRVWRKMASEAIRLDTEWKEGNYTSQPRGLRQAAQLMFFMSSNPVIRQQAAPTRDKTDAQLEAYVQNAMKVMDANNVLYAVEASRDYDPAPGLGRIQAPLVAINFADDLINPPELGILEKNIKLVKRGRGILIPAGPKTAGHGSHTLAALWKDHLGELLKESER